MANDLAVACHALLISLDLANLVYRDEDKRYVLGSLAVSVGRAAASHYSPADLVQRELTQLSQEWGAIAVSNYRRRDAILVREWIDTVRVDAGGSRAGASIPLAPPWVRSSMRRSRGRSSAAAVSSGIFLSGHERAAEPQPQAWGRRTRPASM